MKSVISVSLDEKIINSINDVAEKKKISRSEAVSLLIHKATRASILWYLCPKCQGKWVATLGANCPGGCTNVQPEEVEEMDL